jgi:hypothetical protein
MELDVGAKPRIMMLFEHELGQLLSEITGANQDRPDVRGDWWRVEVGQQAS